MSNSDKVKMTFNGREVEAVAGKPLIELSQELGQEIPHFCYHPGLGVDGNCRMCLVELEGAPKLVTACTLATAEGMVVTSNSEKVIKAREGVLEFILINHPLDCPICDKGGECPLQEYTRLHGPAHSRFKDGKNLSFKHRVIGEHIIFDDERCIRCSRCIRFQRDVAGREELTFKHRGDHILIDLFDERPLTSGFTGNLADICPVGALTTRSFRFQARPWELKRVNTHCGACSLHCAADVWWKDEEVIRLTAGTDSRVNAWWICDKGRFEYPVEDPVQSSLVRRQGEQVPVSYSEATVKARGLIADAGARAGVIAGSRCTNEELAMLAELQNGMRADLSPFPAVRAESEFVNAIAKSGCEIEGLDKLAEFDRVIVLGEDPELSHPIFSLRLGQACQQAAGELQVTLVHDGPMAPVGDFTMNWQRVDQSPAAWLTGEGASALGDSDDLLIVISDALVRNAVVDVTTIDRWRLRTGKTALLHLLHGFNRRGLLTAAASCRAKEDVLSALETGELDTLLMFGVDADIDIADTGRWEQALTRAKHLLVQSTRLDKLHVSAEVLLARRRALDLAGSISNSWGLERKLRSWEPVAGIRPADSDWIKELLTAETPAAAEATSHHES